MNDIPNQPDRSGEPAGGTRPRRRAQPSRHNQPSRISRQPLPEPHGDPGLQPERTTMSWTRTTVSMLVASSILVRWSSVYGRGVFALMAVLLGCAVFVLASSRADYTRGVEGIRDEAVEPNSARVLVLTAAVVTMGVGALLLVALA